MYYCVKHGNNVYYSKRLIDAQYFHAENFSRKDRATLFSVDTEEDLGKLTKSGIKVMPMSHGQE